jgi:hypothetical protein
MAGGGIMGNIIMGNITTQETLTPLNVEDIPGTYVCNTSATCKNKYTLLLKSDKSAELTREVTTIKKTSDIVSGQTANEGPSDNTISSTEIGNWDLGVQNMLVITITGKEESVYDIPQKIVIKNVKNKTLSKISYTKSNYKDMSSPIFIKVVDSN